LFQGFLFASVMSSTMARFLRPFAEHCSSWSTSELNTMNHLVTNHQRFLLDGGRMVVQLETWHTSCSGFLSTLEAVSCALSTGLTPRQYRKAFTVNYKALFPTSSRHYRADIFKASIEQCPTMWVNGDKFEFGIGVHKFAQQLQSQWANLDFMLENCHHHGVLASGHSRSEFSNVLAAVDAAWAGFERSYILELMHIEDQARSWLVQAIKCEEELAHYEAQNRRDVSGVGRRELQQKLMYSLGKLNSVANDQGKGRDSFDVEVLHRANAVLQGCDLDKTFASETAKVLAKEVLDSFKASRKYLQEVSTCLECVDPHLCKNEGLVNRMVDLEESWELGALYVQRKMTLDTLCKWVSHIKFAQEVSPRFAAMCDNCDAEMFMVLPRMIWLSFLKDSCAQGELMSSLLPERFGTCMDKDLQNLVGSFLEVSREVSWEELILKAVSGPVDSANAANAFILKLEKWSMELQRSSPKDWNQCSSVVVQCLNGGPQKQRRIGFNV